MLDVGAAVALGSFAATTRAGGSVLQPAGPPGELLVQQDLPLDLPLDLPPAL